MALLTIDRHRRTQRVLDSINCTLQVLYRGHVLQQCIAADDDAGWAMVHRTRGGKPYFNRETGSSAKSLLVGPVQFAIYAANGLPVKAVMTSDT